MIKDENIKDEFMDDIQIKQETRKEFNMFKDEVVFQP